MTARVNGGAVVVLAVTVVCAVGVALVFRRRIPDIETSAVPLQSSGVS